MTAREEIADIHARLAELHARLAVLYRLPPARPAPTPLPTAEHDEPADVQSDDENPPETGRQLLGWAGRQVPDAMPDVKSWGAARKLKQKIVDWPASEVRSCYHHVRGTRRPAAR